MLKKFGLTDTTVGGVLYFEARQVADSKFALKLHQQRRPSSYGLTALHPCSPTLILGRPAELQHRLDARDTLGMFVQYAPLQPTGLRRGVDQVDLHVATRKSQDKHTTT